MNKTDVEEQIAEAIRVWMDPSTDEFLRYWGDVVFGDVKDSIRAQNAPVDMSIIQNDYHFYFDFTPITVNADIWREANDSTKMLWATIKGIEYALINEWDRVKHS